MYEFEETKPKKKKYIGITLLTLIPLISSFFLIYSIYLISGIEDKLRYIAMGIILIFNIILAIALKKTAKKSKKKLVLSIFLIIIFTAIELSIGYFIYKTYSTLDNMNKDKITYTTAIVTKQDSNLESINDLKDKKIGIVTDETSIDGYIIGLEIIENQKLEDTNEIKNYTSQSSLIKDLYDKKIDAIIISKNYTSMFKTIEDYKNIENETKIIYEKSKTLTKNQIAKYTGDEMLNFNSSDKINKPFTVLVMGIDSTAETLNKNATGNGDSLMLITFNPNTLNATILSIPRDSYVPIACFENQKENKITHAAWNGESCMIKTIQNLTDINIDYYVKVNFQGVIKLVNALDGITVDVPVEFCESNSKRSTKQENLICLKKGKQKLNGEQALALARHRKSLATGDLQRGVDQQIVVQGILNKIKEIRSAKQLLTLLDTISNSMDTNFTTKQILSFYDIAKKLMKTSVGGNLINMQQLYLSGSDQMIYDEGMGLVLYNYILNKESLEQVISTMKQNLEIETPKMIKTMSFNIEKTYKMEPIGKDITAATQTYTLLPSFVGESEGYAENWLSNNGISYNIVTKEVGQGYNNGTILDQSLPSGKRIDLISGSITLTVAKVVQTNNTTKNDKSSDKPSTSDNKTENKETEEIEEPEENIAEKMIE